MKNVLLLFGLGLSLANISVNGQTNSSQTQFGGGVYMNWSSASNGPWPLTWTSQSGHNFQIPVSAVNNVVATNGSFAIPTGTVTTNGLGQTNAEYCVLGVTNVAPFEAIGCDLFYDTFTNEPNYPEWQVALVVSTNVMLSNRVEMLYAGSFLHIQFFSVENAQYTINIQFITNILSPLVQYSTNIYPPSSLLLSLGGGTLHNLEVQRTGSQKLRVLLDGVTGLTVTDTNVSRWWGSGTAWWEISCTGAGTGAAARDSVRTRILDCYTQPTTLSIWPSRTVLNGQFQLTVNGGVRGQRYILLASTNLINWLPLKGFVITNPPVAVYDPDTISYRSRFYKIGPLSLAPISLKLNSNQPLKSNGLNMVLGSLPGLNYEIDACTDLVHWTAITNFAGTNAPLYFTDPQAKVLKQSFYRAVIPQN
jgi:hypothetical protein